MKRSLVLFSGGLDSTAALHLCLSEGSALQAIGFDYGQLHARAELTAARRIAERRNVPYTVLDLTRSLGDSVPDPIAGRGATGVSLANVAVRNLIFLTVAASFGARNVTCDDLELVIGCNADDAEAFPDCRLEFLAAAERCIGLALKGVVSRVSIHAPWSSMTKAEVVRRAMTWADAPQDLAESVSCYRGTACGSCDACALRLNALQVSLAGAE
jgi:7-cyano-7-deazaguanine synthase